MNRFSVKRICFIVALVLLSNISMAQANDGSVSSSIDNTMRSHNKIYVVMAVCITILVVLFLYLIRIDRKVSKKEKSV